MLDSYFLRILQHLFLINILNFGFSLMTESSTTFATRSDLDPYYYRTYLVVLPDNWLVKYRGNRDRVINFLYFS